MTEQDMEDHMYQIDGCLATGPNKRSSGEERNEDQRRIRRSESPIEKHNRRNNPDQD